MIVCFWRRSRGMAPMTPSTISAFFFFLALVVLLSSVSLSDSPFRLSALFLSCLQKIFCLTKKKIQNSNQNKTKQKLNSYFCFQTRNTNNSNPTQQVPLLFQFYSCSTCTSSYPVVFSKLYSKYQTSILQKRGYIFNNKSMI